MQQNVIQNTRTSFKVQMFNSCAKVAVLKYDHVITKLQMNVILINNTYKCPYYAYYINHPN